MGTNFKSIKKMKILYIDMDNVLVDFPSAFSKIDKSIRKEYKKNEDEIPGIFSLMEPMRELLNQSVFCPGILIFISFQRLHGKILLPGRINSYGSKNIFLKLPIKD